MTPDAIVTLLVIAGTVVLLATEWLSMDVVALLAVVTLVLSGVITPEEGISGFSNTATLTVAFMFVISAALLKTGAMQTFASRLANLFQIRYGLGIVAMMLLIGVLSAFVNNTPVVAVFIPVVIQLAHSSVLSPAKLLIPLSFASIFGGICTLVGTSTNIVVSGIAEREGLEGFSMFELTPIGLILALAGVLYLWILGPRLLPNRKFVPGLRERFGMRGYLTEIELLDGAEAVGKKIMEADLVKELEMDIIEVKRKQTVFNLPQGDFRLKAGDVLKVRCDASRIKQLKDAARVKERHGLRVGTADLGDKSSTLVELVIPAESDMEGQTLKEIDFRRRFRAVPLAIRQRREIQHVHLYDIPLKSGDVILAEVKRHFVEELKRRENDPGWPYIIRSENPEADFDKRKFALVVGIIGLVVIGAATGLVHLLTGAMAGVVALVLLGVLTMKDAYEAISWKIIFLLAGALSLGVAMHNSGLDQLVAERLVDLLDDYHPTAVLSGLYVLTAVFTELMSNNATAALMAPVAIATANQLGQDATPFLITICIAASASFMTPIGYQTNTMVFSAGQYRFFDFLRVGTLLTLIFWVLSTIFIPLLYF